MTPFVFVPHEITHLGSRGDVLIGRVHGTTVPCFPADVNLFDGEGRPETIRLLGFEVADPTPDDEALLVEGGKITSDRIARGLVVTNLLLEEARKYLDQHAVDADSRV